MRVSHQHVYDSLAHMLSAGVSLKPALLTSVAQGSGALPAAVTAVANVIERGSALAAAIAGHPKVFPRFDIAVVEIAEMSGRLPLLFQGRTTIEYLFCRLFHAVLFIAAGGCNLHHL